MLPGTVVEMVSHPGFIFFCICSVPSSLVMCCALVKSRNVGGRGRHIRIWRGEARWWRVGGRAVWYQRVFSTRPATIVACGIHTQLDEKRAHRHMHKNAEHAQAITRRPATHQKH